MISRLFVYRRIFLNLSEGLSKTSLRFLRYFSPLSLFNRWKRHSTNINNALLIYMTALTTGDNVLFVSILPCKSLVESVCFMN